MLNKKSLLVFWGVFVITVSAVSCTPQSVAPIINGTTQNAVIEYETAQQAVDDTNDTVGIAHISANEPSSISVVNENLDILLGNYSEFDDEQNYITAHPEAFAAIVALGEDAISYLDNVSDGFVLYDSSVDNYRRIIAMAARYAIKPELYDLVYPSPDGRLELKLMPETFYTLWDPFGGIEYSVHITDLETGESITPLNTETVVSGDVHVEWSPDSRYVAVSRSHRHDFTDLLVFDIGNAARINLSDRTTLEALFGRELVIYDSETGIDYDRIHCYFEEWGEGSITVSVFLRSAVGGEVIFGRFEYDLVAG